MKKGLVIAFPTDTVYGIATPVFDHIGLNRINQLKGRSSNQRMAVLCSSMNMIESLAVLDDTSRKLISAFMPGAFTLIIPANEEYLKKTNEDTIGVRIPNNKEALQIINELGPLKTTSINKHNEPPIDSYLEIVEKYHNDIDVIYEKKRESSGLSSTVVSYLNKEVKVIREGFVTIEKINSVLNK